MTSRREVSIRHLLTLTLANQPLGLKGLNVSVLSTALVVGVHGEFSEGFSLWGFLC